MLSHSVTVAVLYLMVPPYTVLYIPKLPISHVGLDKCACDVVDFLCTQLVTVLPVVLYQVFHLSYRKPVSAVVVVQAVFKCHSPNNLLIITTFLNKPRIAENVGPQQKKFSV